MKTIVGFTTDTKCTAVCWNAKGSECRCSCGGLNHGTGIVSLDTGHGSHRNVITDPTPLQLLKLKLQKYINVFHRNHKIKSFTFSDGRIIHCCQDGCGIHFNTVYMHNLDKIPNQFDKHREHVLYFRQNIPNCLECKIEKAGAQ